MNVKVNVDIIVELRRIVDLNFLYFIVFYNDSFSFFMYLIKERDGKKDFLINLKFIALISEMPISCFPISLLYILYVSEGLVFKYPNTLKIV